MASSTASDTKGADNSSAESEDILSLLYKICSQDIYPAKKCAKSLPLICKLLTTDFDLKGSRLKLILEMLNMTFERLLSIFIHSQDWNAVEGLFTVLKNSDLVTTKLVSDCTMQLDKAYFKELASHTSLLNERNLDDSILNSIQHVMTSGSVLPLNILLRMAGCDYEKRNSTFGSEANTLLHMACSGTRSSSFPLLPVWLLGLGLDPNIANKDGKLPADLLLEDSAIKHVFTKLCANKWINDLAYMEHSAVKQFLLQQLCTSGQWLDLRNLITQLEKITKDDYSKPLLALEGKRWNTACKTLLDCVGVTTQGLSVLKMGLLECDASVKRDLLLSVLDSVMWRLRYETMDTPYTQPQWLIDVALRNKSEDMPHDSLLGSREEVPSVSQLMPSSYWFQKTVATDSASKSKTKTKTKAPRKRQLSEKRGNKRDRGDASKQTNFEKEICRQISPKQNAAVFMLHIPSHIIITADVINKHFSQQDADFPDSKCSVSDKPSAENCAEPSANETNEEGDFIDKGQSSSGTKRAASAENIEESSQLVSGSFYKQQRKRRARQRQRHNTVSEETVQGSPRPGYKRKQRRRTKSSSDSLSYLEDDISGIKSGIAKMEMEEKDFSEGELEEDSVLVVLPSSRAIPASVEKLRSLLPYLTITEHGATSKPKVGIRRLFKTNQVVVSHLPAVRNSIKAKSFCIQETTLVVFMDIIYTDDLFTLLPNKMESTPTVVMIYKEFPYRSDICSLESVLQYVKAKLGIQAILSLNDNKSDLLGILYPGVSYAVHLSREVDMAGLVSTLRGQMSTAFGTNGEVHGCIYAVNTDYSTDAFRSMLTEECVKILPSTFKVHLVEARSKKLKQDLFLLSTVQDFDQQAMDLGSRRCNFAAFITQSEHQVRIEAVQAESLSQLCIDQLHCQQYIKIV